MLTWHDVLTYVRLFLRWWFVLALAVALAVGTAWYMVRQQPDIYLSQATLMVGNNFEVSAPTQAQVALSNVLADYYAALTKREVILAPVVERLQLTFPWQVIRDRMLATRVDRGANLLEIKITDTNPERAAAIANAIAEELIAYTPNAPEKIAAQQAEISRRLEEAQANMQAVDAKIAELEERLKNLSSAIDISDVQQQLQALQLTRQRYLDEYTNLINLSNQTSANSLSLFEAARPAAGPLPQKRSLTLATAGLGGLLMAIVAALVLDRLDERWRTSSELQSRTGIRSLGELSELPPYGTENWRAESKRQESLNRLYSNMVHAARSKLPRTLLISSPQKSSARSSVAIEIARMYIRTGHRVLLVDAEGDTVHIPQMLAQRAHGRNGTDANGKPFGVPGSLWAYIRPTGTPNLLVLSGREAGYSRFSELVPLVFWPEMLEHLRKATDVVIFDGPAALEGPDAGLLAPLVDGVMLVVNGRSDSRSTVIEARKQLTSEPETRFLGAVIATPASRTLQGPSSASAKAGGFRVSVTRNGITIVVGDQAASSASPSDQAPVPTPRLLTATETPLETEHTNGNGALNPEPVSENITLEDLLELERCASSAPPDFQTTREPRPEVIITPPPDDPPLIRVTGNGAYRSATPPSRQRRARIANSRYTAHPADRNHRATNTDGKQGTPSDV
ncbi:MAG: lipopolysaccharide biosynthesis protein [Chloroflexaceae bacterium]|nr:lipopolysaccharide biosynthesis protein [Chloroflexaceae bacterium]